MKAYGKLTVNGCDVVLDGVIDPCEIGQLRELFGQIMTNGMGKVQVDMSQVSEICPECLNYLATIYEILSTNGGSLAVTRASGPVKRAFDATGLNRLLGRPNPYGDNLVPRVPPMN